MYERMQAQHNTGMGAAAAAQHLDGRLPTQKLVFAGENSQMRPLGSLSSGPSWRQQWLQMTVEAVRTGLSYCLPTVDDPLTLGGIHSSHAEFFDAATADPAIFTKATDIVYGENWIAFSNTPGSVQWIKSSAGKEYIRHMKRVLLLIDEPPLALETLALSNGIEYLVHKKPWNSIRRVTKRHQYTVRDIQDGRDYDADYWRPENLVKLLIEAGLQADWLAISWWNLYERFPPVPWNVLWTAEERAEMQKFDFDRTMRQLRRIPGLQGIDLYIDPDNIEDIGRETREVCRLVGVPVMGKQGGSKRDPRLGLSFYYAHPGDDENEDLLGVRESRKTTLG